MGAWFAGERVVYRGRDLFDDLGSLSWMGLLLYGVTGRILDERQVRLFEGLWKICMSYPEPRIWNNRVAALAGAARSTEGLGVGAATAISEAVIYGHRPRMAAAEFLLNAAAHVDEGRTVDSYLDGVFQKAKTLGHGRPGSGRNRTVSAAAGYGRPLATEDERIGPMMRLAKDLGFADGRLVRLAFEIEVALVRRRPEWRMNAAALNAALTMDQGLTPRQMYQYAIPCFVAGMIPCAIDTVAHEEGTFFPLSCQRVSYQGVGRRAWDCDTDG